MPRLVLLLVPRVASNYQVGAAQSVGGELEFFPSLSASTFQSQSLTALVDRRRNHGRIEIWCPEGVP